jgi:hypothetical protein
VPSAFLGDDHPAEVLQVDLVADARIGGYHGEIVEAFLGPLEQLVAFAVAARILWPRFFEGIGGAVIVHLDAVVDDEFGGHQGVDQCADRRPGSLTASRMAARSTTAGTPVKSCMSTRAGW